MATPAVDRCFRFFKRGHPEDCWHWTGARNPNGYGLISEFGRSKLAHRVVYEALCEPIPLGLDLDHTCHNADEACPGGRACTHRRCVNPWHLEVVTNEE